jgi:hypothetical protein
LIRSGERQSKFTFERREKRMASGEDFVEKYVPIFMPEDKKDKTEMMIKIIKNELYCGESSVELFTIDEVIEIISESITFVFSS